MILVSGAGGTIGRAVMARLELEGIEAVGLYKSQIDLSLNGDLEKIIRKRPDTIIHLAAAVPSSLSFPDSTQRALITRSIDQSIFNAATYWGCRVIYTSGCALYDRRSPETKVETMPIEPKINSPYLTAKYEGERLFQLLGSSCTLRVSAPIGLGLPEAAVAKRFLSSAIAGEPIRVWGSGLREQNYVDVADIADAIFRASLSGATGIFNIAADYPTTMLQLAEIITSVVSHSSFELSGLADPNEPEFARYSNSKSFEYLDWRPKIALADSIHMLYRTQYAG